MTECPRHLIPVAFHILLVVVRCPDNPSNVTSHTRFLCYANYHAILFCLQSYEKSRAKQKKYSFFCRDRVSSPSLMAKLRKVESKTKEKKYSFFHKDRKDLLFSESETEADLQVGAEGMLFEVCVYVAVVVDVPTGTSLAIKANVALQTILGTKGSRH